MQRDAGLGRWFSRSAPVATASVSGVSHRGPWTVPNAITLARLLLVPVFLWFLFARDNRAAAAWILAVIGMTDWTDGYVARRFDQVSDLGKVLDPVTDRIVLLVTIGALLVDGAVPRWVAVLALAREAAVSVTGLALGAMGARRIDVTYVGKTGSFALMIAFPLFCAGSSTLSYADLAQALGWVAAIPGLALSYYSAVGYVPLARRALAEGRL
jgi:cardiolipin synthase